METMNSNLYGRVEKGKKALIIYASISGNSEKIAKAFERTLLHYGFEVDMFKAVDSSHYVKIEGYDLYIVGTGIVGGVPEKNLLAAFGAGNYTNMKQLAEIGGDTGAPQWGRGVKLSKGIIFLTYGGNRRGPSEILASASLLEMMMTDMGITVIGEFACAGISKKKHSHNMSDDLALALNTSVEEVAPLLEAYTNDPNSEYCMSLPQNIRDLLQKSVDSYQEVDLRRVGVPYAWHNETIARPSERDIAKAEIFMSEIIEDVFLPHEKETIESRYMSIS